MLELGKGWRFPIDDEVSKIWLTPKGAWGLSVRCKSTKVKVDGAFEETLAPRLIIDDLTFMGSHWQDLVGMEIAQEGAWHGDGDPSASLVVEQSGDLRAATVRVIGCEGKYFEVEVDGECDIFIDDDHDKDVPFTLKTKLVFEGVQFRFRADGLDSREPERKAIELLSKYLEPEGFMAPEVESLTEPGLFMAKFAPQVSEDDVGGEVSDDADLSPEMRVLHQSATELLGGMLKQEWIELEDGGVAKLVPGMVDILELGGRGSRRAERVSEWLMEQDDVIDLHVNDEDLASVLDKFW
ncbi:MAG: hypothetical protein ACI9KE_003628 [Polyangiales bacterium]|jgi:hypothetical protein